MVFGFRFFELRAFLETRYQYLEGLGQHLEENFQAYCEEKRKHQIDHRHPHSLHYPLSKALECLTTGKFDPLIHLHLKQISDFLRPYVLIKEDMSDSEIYMLIMVGLYNYWLHVGQ